MGFLRQNYVFALIVLFLAGGFFVGNLTDFMQTLFPARQTPTTTQQAAHQPRQQSQPQAKPAQTAPAATTPPASVTAPSLADQHYQAQKLLLRASAAQAEAVRLSDQWKEDIEPLRHGSSGDVIAGNPDLVEKLAFVFKRKLVNESELNVMGREIDSLLKLVDKAASKNPPEAIPVAAMTDVGQIQINANTARDGWEQSLEDARAIVRVARDQYKQKEQRVNAARDDEIRRLREDKGTLQDKIDTIEARNRLNDIDQEIDTGVRPNASPPQSGIATTPPPQTVPAKPKYPPALRAKALSPEVRGSLAVFMEPRSVQPSMGRSMVKFDAVFDKQPMSYSRLIDCGALEQTVKGLQILGDIGCGAFSDRLSPPKWSRAMRTAPASWPEHQKQKVKKAQSMLIEYGPILVDEGLLSP